MNRLLSPRLAILPATALLALGGLLGAPWMLGPYRAPDPAAARSIASVAPVGAASSTESMVSLLQERLKVRPADGLAYAQLGGAYVQKARETGDPSYYAKAEGVLQKALDLQPEHADALIAMGTLALARHQFREALTWGEQAHRLNPDSATVYGVLGDAHLELGEYAEAFQAFQEMVNRRPDLSSYARVSYARELTGDVPGAIAAMKAAADASGDLGEGGAWARTHLGYLYWTYQGDQAQAESAYQRALLVWPDYAPALAGLAQVAAARGDWEGALGLARRAAVLLPLPEHVIFLGDLLRASGHPKEAAQQDALVRAIDRLQRAAGMDTDLETALFEADLGDDPAGAVAAARRGYERRPGVKGADILAWALFRAGLAAEARPVMEQALSLGSKDPLTHYHAAKIALAAGPPEASPAAERHLTTALTANRHFSLRYAGDARLTLEALQEGGQR